MAYVWVAKKKSEVIQSLISIIGSIYTPVEYVTKYFYLNEELQAVP